MTVDLDSQAALAHLETTTRSWLGLRADSPLQVPRLPSELARLLLRAEEYEQPHRDQWDCWEFGFSDNFHRGCLWEPEVDRWLVERRRELSAHTELEPLWPDGRRFAVCMTHDVDLVSRASTPRQALRSMRTSLADRPRSLRGRAVKVARPAVRAARAAYNGISTAPLADTLETSLRLEQECGVRSSYFFTVYPAGDSSRYDCVYDFDDVCRFRGERVRVREVIRAIHDEGFDVGLHGSYNSPLVPGLLAREKSRLEAAVEAPVTTNRQHFLHWSVSATPELQASAGLRIDASVGFNRNLGFRAGTSLPFRWFDLDGDTSLDLLELPTLVHDGALLRPDALELDGGLARIVLERFFDTVAEVGGVVTLVFHPNNLEREDYLELFRVSMGYGLELGGWFASVAELDRWWRDRDARLGLW